MAEQEDPRLAKIRALLAQAESTNFPEEAKVFTAKAQELMTKWAIDDAMLDAAGRSGRRLVVESTKIVVGNPPYQGPKEELLWAIAKNLDCKLVFQSVNQRGESDAATGEWVKFKKARRYTFAYVIGFPRDLEFVQMLFTSCLLQADVEFLSADVQQQLFAETSHPGHRVRWRNAFMMGYASVIRQRLRQMKAATEKAAESTTPGVGLVLANKADQVLAKRDEMFGKLGSKSGSSAGFDAGSGRDMGQAAAHRADLGRGNKVAGSKGALSK